MPEFIEVEPVASAHHQLSPTVARLSEAGLMAQPVIIGRHGKPEAVIISFELFRALADPIDAIQAAPLIRERLASTKAAGGPMHTTLEQLAQGVGVNLDDLPDT
jgi:PHD/YefM family antitoxin component YafN of YafNO toxin-antitoxin module